VLPGWCGPGGDQVGQSRTQAPSEGSELGSESLTCGSGPALAGLRPAFSDSDFFEKFWSRCLSIWAEVGMKNRRFREKYKKLGLENLWQCRSTPKTSNLWIKTTKNSTNQEIKIQGNFGAIFWIFKIYGVNHNTRVNPWQPKAVDTIL
jgi:hypothetical protein